jgi:small subunit ribosomal protein S8
MSMTDPVADLLTRIRNGSKSRLEHVSVPASRLKANIVKVLREEGFIGGFKLVRNDGKASIDIQLKYDRKGMPVISGIRRVSRPGRRRYVGYQEVTRVRSGIGVAILSTSQGVMTGRQAKGKKAGGEYLCEVW